MFALDVQNALHAYLAVRPADFGYEFPQFSKSLKKTNAYGSVCSARELVLIELKVSEFSQVYSLN